MLFLIYSLFRESTVEKVYSREYFTSPSAEAPENRKLNLEYQETSKILEFHTSTHLERHVPPPLAVECAVSE